MAKILKASAAILIACVALVAIPVLYTFVMNTNDNPNDDVNTIDELFVDRPLVVNATGTGLMSRYNPATNPIGANQWVPDVDTTAAKRIIISVGTASNPAAINFLPLVMSETRLAAELGEELYTRAGQHRVFYATNYNQTWVSPYNPAFTSTQMYHVLWFDSTRQAWYINSVAYGFAESITLDTMLLLTANVTM